MRLVSVAKGKVSIPHNVPMQTQKSITAQISRKPADGIKAKIILCPFPSVIKRLVVFGSFLRKKCVGGNEEPHKSFFIVHGICHLGPFQRPL